MSTPLMVWLTRTVYATPPDQPGDLLDRQRFDGQEAIENHLLGSLTSALYRRRVATTSPASAGYRPEQATRWLRFIALYLTRMDTREFAWWDLHKSLGRYASLAMGSACATVFATSVIAVFAAVPALRPALGFDVASAALMAPVAGWAIGAAGPPGFPAQLTVRGRGLRSYAVAFAGTVALALGTATTVVSGPALGTAITVLGFAVAVVIGLLDAPDVTHGPDPVLAYRNDGRGLLALVATGFVGGLVGGTLIGVLVPGVPVDFAGFVTTALAYGLSAYFYARRRRTRFPSRGRRILAAALGALIGGAVGLVPASFIGGRIAGLPVAIAGGLVAGVGLTAFVGLGLTASAWFAMARICLVVQRRLPWRLLAFLEDAYHRGVLRKSGPHYQFRHDRLVDSLTNPDESGR